MKREILETYGVRGNNRVIVVRDLSRDPGRILVERYVGSKPKRKTFSLSKEGERQAKLYAIRIHDSPNNARERKQRTLRELWTAFQAGPRWKMPPEHGGLRPRTKQLYTDRWSRFELFAQPDTPAEDVTFATLDEFWNRMYTGGTAPNQIRAVVTAVKVVYSWAESRELITRNRIRQYGKDQNAMPMEVPEYLPVEFERIQATCQPQDGTQWRFAALWTFVGTHGFRVNAALHLRWEDVDFEGGTVTMIPEHDKMHKRITRPLTWDSYSALLTAKYWRERLGYEGPWVFFAGQSRRAGPWSYQAANLALARAEVKAGVTHVKFRAFHGARRTVSGNVSIQTGDPGLAMQWIGDDIRQAKKYIKERAAEFERIAEFVSA